MRKPLCISYLRYSSNRQSKGTSIERQLEMSQQWAARNGYVIDDTLRDPKTSAFRGTNAATGKLASLLKRIESGDIPPGSVLICENLDRLSRQQVGEAVEMFLGIINRGVRVVTVGDDAREYAHPCDMMDVMYAVMSLSRGNEESRTKSSRSTDNWNRRREKAKNGEALLSSKLPCWLTFDAKGKIVVDKTKAAAVKKCFELALKGFGVGAIVRKLNAEKVQPPAGGKLWYTRFVWRLFREEAVIGVKVTKRFDAGKRIPVDSIADYYPAIISPETYASVGAMMSSRSNRKYGKRESAEHCNLFRDILKDENGHSFTSMVRPSGKKRVRYLVSLGAYAYKTKAVTYVREDLFTLAFIDVFTNHFPESFERKKSGDSSSELDSALGELHKLDKAIEQLEASVVDDLDTSPTKLRLIGKLEAKREEAAHRVRNAQQSSALTDSESLEDAIDRVLDLLSDNMSFDERVEVSGVIRQFIDTMTLTTKKVKLVSHDEDDDETPRGKMEWLVGNVTAKLRGGGELRYRFQYPNTKSKLINKRVSLAVSLVDK